MNKILNGVLQVWMIVGVVALLVCGVLGLVTIAIHGHPIIAIVIGVTALGVLIGLTAD